MSALMDQVSATTIEHLDHDVPCGVNNRKSGKCMEAADWWIQATAHCDREKKRSGFMCTQHFDRLMSGALFRCPACDVRESPLDRVIRTERIR